MAVALLRPNGDVLAEWTETPTGAAWSTIDDVVEQPTVPDTADFVSTTGQNNVSRHGLTTVAVGSVSQAKLWVYGAHADSLDAGHNWFAGLHKPDDVEITTVTFWSEDVGDFWHSATFVGALTQVEVDGLYIKLASGAVTAPHDHHCYAAYVELTYEPPALGVVNLPLLGVG